MSQPLFVASGIEITSSYLARNEAKMYINIPNVMAIHQWRYYGVCRQPYRLLNQLLSYLTDVQIWHEHWPYTFPHLTYFL